MRVQEKKDNGWWNNVPASLTRVSIWENEHGWQPTNAQIVAQTHKHSIGIDSKLFLCELCGQYASFVNGAYTPFFRHPIGSTDCVEKADTPYLKANPLGFSLPLRIKIENGHLDVQIGFLPVGEAKLNNLQHEGAQLSILIGDRNIKTYNIDHSRFMTDSVSYLSVGANIAERYNIDCGGKVERIFWPTIVEGVYKDGSLFDKTSGKRLPHNANVEVGREYLLISKRQCLYSSSYGGIEIEQMSFTDNYFIYVVKATSLSRYAADFFLTLKARLTDSPTELIQLYPFVLRASHTVIHNASKLWFYKSNGFVDTCPAGSFKELSQNIVEVKGVSQKILSLSRFEERTSVLRFIMLRKDVSCFDKAVCKHHEPTVNVCDDDNVEISTGQHSTLPKGRAIKVSPEFDGFINVLDIFSGLLLKRYDLKNGTKITINVEFGQRYRIFQGLDCLHDLTFIREKKINSIADEQILRNLRSYKGQSVTISHNFGAIVEKLEKMPLSRLWVMKQIRRGSIDKGAKDYLIKL